MASRIKVDEVTNLAQSGAVSFPTGGANFSGDVAVTGNLSTTGSFDSNIGGFTEEKQESNNKSSHPVFKY